MLTRFIVPLLTAAALTVSACSASAPDPAPTSAPPESPSSLTPDTPTTEPEPALMRNVSLEQAQALPEVVAAMRSMGITALGHGADTDNFVFSPLSLAVALAMLAEGAQAQTAAELDAALGASGQERLDAFAALQGELLQHDGDPKDAVADELPDHAIIHLANRVVLDDDFEVHEAYLDALADGFGAHALRTDLGAPDAKEVLSAWVSEHTGGLVPESAIEPNDSLRLVLQDALLVAARWQQPFESDDTRERDFTLASGEVIETPTMYQGDAFLAVAQAQDWTAARLPYTEAMHADVFLPPEGQGPETLTLEVWEELTAALDEAAPNTVVITLPTLDIEAEDPFNMVQSGYFDDLGIADTLCGSPVVDLSGIAQEPGDLCVDQAVQQTVLKVDEEGTVAAAVTEISVAEAAAMQPEQEVRFDRPFVFTLIHTDTQTPMFLAGISDPRH